MMLSDGPERADSDREHFETASESAPVRNGVQRITFWRSHFALWFISIVANSVTSSVISNELKYYYVLQYSNEHATNTKVNDIVFSTDCRDKYLRLKEKFISVFEESGEKRLQRLLETELRQDKPSELLRRMRDVAKDKVADSVLRLLWFQQLPQETQVVLSGLTQPLDQLATLADRIADIRVASFSNATLVVDALESCQQQFSAILDRLEQLEIKLTQRDTTRTRRRRRRRSKKPSPRRRSCSNDGVACWYHQQFKAKAKNCTGLCTWQSKSSGKTNIELRTTLNSLESPLCLLAARDRRTGTLFLIDTGATLSIIPIAETNQQNVNSDLVLCAANNTLIRTFGKRTIKVNLGRQMGPFRWEFVIAEVNQPTIGIDFLSNFNLLVDTRNRRLIDGNTNRSLRLTEGKYLLYYNRY